MNNTNEISRGLAGLGIRIAILVVGLVLAIVLIRAVIIFILRKIDEKKSYKKGVKYKITNDYIRVKFQSYEERKKREIDKLFVIGNVYNLDNLNYPVRLLRFEIVPGKSNGKFLDDLFNFDREIRFYYEYVKNDASPTNVHNIENYGVMLQDSSSGNISVGDIKPNITKTYTNEVSMITENQNIDRDDQEFLLEIVHLLDTNGKVSKKNASTALDIIMKVVGLAQSIPTLVKTLQSLI